MSRTKNFKEIYVIGTGLSSLISILFLVSKGIKPIVIDIGNKYEKSNYKVPIFKPYFYKKKIEEVSFFGGLSNIWNGVVKFSSKKDYDELDIPNSEDLIKEMLIYMDNLFFFSNVKIDKNKFQLQRIADKNLVIENLLKKFDGMHQPIIMSSEENYCLPYNTSQKINDLIKNNKITFIKGKVLSIKSHKNQNFIEFISNQKTFLNKYNYVFCGAGVISSNKIIRESIKIDSNLNLRSSQKWLIFSLYKNKKKINNSFPLYQGAITENGKTKIYIQSNLLSQLMRNKLSKWLRLIVEILLKLTIFNYISICYVSVIEDKNDKTKIDKFYSYFKDLNKLSKKINNFQKLFRVFPLGIKLPKLGGNHFGSSFPLVNDNDVSNKLNKENNSNQYGSIKNIENFSVIDMTTLPKIHVVPPSLNLMLHSLKITKKVFYQLIKNKNFS